MRVICLDLEGVLVPEIWISLAEKTKLEKLKLTTRDMKNYDELMLYRLNILRQNQLKISDILNVVDLLEPFEGAVELLNKLSKKNQVIILSDTFYEISYPLIEKLGYPNIFCHHLSLNDKGEIIEYKLRQANQKKAAVEAFKSLNFDVFAVGDSYNDLDMLKSADCGILYMPPKSLLDEYSGFPAVYNYRSLYKLLTRKI